MPPLGPSVRLGVNVLAVAATVAFAALLWRRRSEPTARPLLGLSVVLLAAASTHLALTELLADEDAWVLAAFAFTTVAMCLWFLFAVRYTGRGKRTTWLATLLLLVLPTIVLGISIAAIRAGPELRPYVDAFLGVFMLLVTAIVVVGVFFVIAESFGENAFPFRESLLLSGGATGLALSPLAVSIFVAPLAVPLSLGAASVLFAATVHQYPLFETLPVARVAGRDRIIDEMTDAVVVVDRGTAVRDLNAAAERIFGVDRQAALDCPLSTVLPDVPDPDALVDGEDPAQVLTGEGVALTVTAERVTDDRDRHVGYLLVCRDVTDRRNRERRLTVLNQLLVGALRERMAAVADDARSILDAEEGLEEPIDLPADPDPAAVGDRVWTETTHLTRLVTHAREIERALSDGGATPTTDVRDAIRTVANRTDEGVDVAVDLPADPIAAGVDDALLRTALALLVEDARSRGIERVRIVAFEGASEVVVHVVDDHLDSADDDRSDDIDDDRSDDTDGDRSDSAGDDRLDRSRDDHDRRASETDDGVPIPGSERPTGVAEGETEREAIGGEAIGGEAIGDEASRSGVAVRMARLAVDHVGGDVATSTTEDGRRLVVVEVPASTPADAADEGAIRDVSPDGGGGA